METAEKLDLDFAEFVGGPPVTVDPIEQLIAEADARLDRADAAVEAADKAAKEAEEAAGNAQRARRHSDDLTISAGIMYTEAKAALIERNAKLPKEQRVTWEAYLEKHSRHSPRRVREVMAIARSSNPKRAAQDYRERDASKKQKARSRVSETAGQENCPAEEPTEGGELTDRVEPREWFERAKTLVQSAPSMQWAHQFDNWYVLEYRPAMGFEIRAPKVGGSPKPPKPAPTPKIADPRVTGAIGHFFESVPANKRLWLQQRMEEQPTTMKGDGVHIQWIEAFWDSTPEQQSAIREGIKLENTKRMEG